MLEDAYFTANKKSLAGQAIDLLVMAYDVISTIIIGFPMILVSIHKLFYSPRKDIRGKLALVNKFLK